MLSFWEHQMLINSNVPKETMDLSVSQFKLLINKLLTLHPKAKTQILGILFALLMFTIIYQVALVLKILLQEIHAMLKLNMASATKMESQNSDATVIQL